MNDSKKTEFVSLLRNIGIRYTPQGGGAYLHKKTYKSKKRLRKTRKIYKQHGGMTSTEFNTELKEHLYFLNNFFKAEKGVQKTSGGAGGGVINDHTSISNIFGSKFDYLNQTLQHDERQQRGRSMNRTPRTKRNASRSRNRDAKQQRELRGRVYKPINKPINFYEYNMDFLEFYEEILGKDNSYINTLLNRYRIMNYLNKNSFSDIEESIKRIRVGDMPDPMRNAVDNDSIIKFLTKQVTNEAIDKVKTNIEAIREICKRDIESEDGYIDITAEIDGHLGKAHEYLKVAEGAYEANQLYLSSRYELAIQYLQEVLTLYPVVVGASAVAATSDVNMLTSGNVADGPSPQSEASNRRRNNILSQPPEPPSPSQATESQSRMGSPDRSPRSGSAVPSQFGSPFGSPVGARQTSNAASYPRRLITAVSPIIVANDNSSTIISPDRLNLSLMGKLKFTMDAIRASTEEKVTYESMEHGAGGGAVRRESPETVSSFGMSNGKRKRKTQRKPRR